MSRRRSPQEGSSGPEAGQGPPGGVVKTEAWRPSCWSSSSGWPSLETANSSADGQRTVKLIAGHFAHKHEHNRVSVKKQQKKKRTKTCQTSRREKMQAGQEEKRCESVMRKREEEREL